MKRLFLQLIAILEIVGGIWGLSIMLYRMGNVLDNFKFLLFLLLYLLPFIFSLCSGILLWKQKSIGLTLSLVLQLLQIPYFALAGLYYSFISGVLAGIRISFLEGMTHYNFNFLFGGYCQIQTGLPIGISAFGINLFAVITFVFLLFNRLQCK
ncbi:MAG: hypothetical protein DRH06_03850 [Deltaproteobacteria bacterium]|nr:MAG: hypothetical protein DRH07_04320 [Deltaproteobacteria bacterium]RLB77408.1 MAG: hypothetical protein DRH06_03850 [Deltaproteobacteria bacterium]